MSSGSGSVVLGLAAALAAACGDGAVSGDDTVDAMVPPPPDAAPVPDVLVADAVVPDAFIAMSISQIIPAAASRQVDTTLTVLGFHILPGAAMVLENCDTAIAYDLSATVVVAADGGSLTAELVADPTREQGLYTVRVENPGGQSDLLECAFRVLAAEPPTVLHVMPATAFRGIPGDGVSSDQTVSIVGASFQSTPSVRWVKTDGSATYEALFVGFVSAAEITAVCPSETLGMAVGDYHVHVVNPDLLSGVWQVDDGMGGIAEGIFSVTTAPPPAITDITPARIENGSCTTTIMTITGAGFQPAATMWYVADAGDACAGSILDASGDTLCPIVVDGVDPGGAQITAHFDPCPSLGPHPIAVVNPDGQTATYFSVEITPSSDGHLNTGAFEVMTSKLVTGRWRHATAYGFDPFGNAYLYAVGGQDATGGVLGSVEVSQLGPFGTPGPFAHALQYGDVNAVRVANDLVVPRLGAALVRVGRDLFSIGGAVAATDGVTLVAASAVVERARILGFAEMPAIKLPHALGGTGLPEGTWYYQVAAVGPWGESLASREVVMLTTAGRIEVCWDPPATAGATSYHVYRSLAADGRAGTAALIALEQPAGCLVDDGGEELTPAPGNLRGVVAAGSLLVAGDHIYRVSANTTAGGMAWETYAGYAVAVELTNADLAAGNAAIALAWDEIAGATYNLYKWNAASASFALLDTGGPLFPTSFVDDGAAFAASAKAPRGEARPLPAGSLSTWNADPVALPQLSAAREGLDGVVIHMDPATSGGLVARILVAGGRTDNSGAAGTYLPTAESLGVFEDGTLEASWFNETPEFVVPRAYFALVSTQRRNETDFPPPPEEPPCGDLDGDGFLSCDCAEPGTPLDMLDCNDGDSDIHPGATEICGDGIDQDCDMGCTGTDLPCPCTDDLDGDGHISLSCLGDDCCDTGADTSLGCTDARAPGIHPGAAEICDNGIDEDCDGIDPPCDCVDDLDGDTHISLDCGGDDCCDTGADTSLGCTDGTAPGIHPGAMEICSNGIDEDCDGFDTVCRAGPAWGFFAQPMCSLDPTPPPRAIPEAAFAVLGAEPVYVVAVFGDADLVATNNEGLPNFEACLVDVDTGHLSCGASWILQVEDDPKSSFGNDALLYFDYLYPFYGVNRETIATDPSTRTFHNSAIGRFDLDDLAAITGGQIFGTRQSASTSFAINRSYYKLERLMSFVYAVGGWAEAHTDELGTAVPEGPTDTVERHQQ
jgi:hypothetical protein